MLRSKWLVSVLLLAASTGLSQQPRTGVTGEHLLRTAWGGSAPFNASAPGGATLGCHSVAFAQVMCFHRLAPHGTVAYTCANGTVIAEDFSDYAPPWDAFALDAGSATADTAAARTTSRFAYTVASIIRKDFGTDQYVDDRGDFHKKAIEAHFACTLTSYPREVSSSVSRALSDGRNLSSLIKAEIGSGRPTGFYYTDRQGGGHAVVIDGYTVKDGKPLFHVNFGWSGRSDGWYSLDEDLPPNTRELAVITIVPRGPAGAFRQPRRPEPRPPPPQ